jgi:hypothetical protein
VRKIYFFFCSVCLLPSVAKNGNRGREGLNCIFCNATSRDRAMAIEIHRQYFAKKRANPRRPISIVGISDGHDLSKSLKKIYRGNYRNFKFHVEPKLDITSVPRTLYGTVDIISCSEVLEHVQPPVEQAFLGLSLLLKANGVLVISVPHTNSNGQHIEHFPELKNSKIILSEEGNFLSGINLDGILVKFNKLVFHGGEGETLEYRIFSRGSLIHHLQKVNFYRLTECKNNRIFGVAWEPWSRVWTANKADV